MDRPPQQNIQDAFLNTARRDKQDVSIQQENELAF